MLAGLSYQYRHERPLASASAVSGYSDKQPVTLVERILDRVHGVSPSIRSVSSSIARSSSATGGTSGTSGPTPRLYATLL